MTSPRVTGCCGTHENGMSSSGNSCPVSRKSPVCCRLVLNGECIDLGRSVGSLEIERFCSGGIVPSALYGMGLKIRRRKEPVCVRQVDLAGDEIVWQDDDRVVRNALRQPLVAPWDLKDPRLVPVGDRDDTSVAVAICFDKPACQQDALAGGVGLFSDQLWQEVTDATPLQFGLLFACPCGAVAADTDTLAVEEAVCEVLSDQLCPVVGQRILGHGKFQRGVWLAVQQCSVSQPRGGRMLAGLDDVVTYDQPVRVILVVADDKRTRLRCGSADDDCRAVEFIVFGSRMNASTLLQCLQGGSDAGQTFLHSRARACDVHAREALAAGTKDVSFVQTDSGLLAQEARELMDVHAERAEVQPHQVRSLDGHDLDLWHVVLDEQSDIRHVAFDVVQYLGEPVVALPERSFQCSVSKWRDTADSSVDASLQSLRASGSWERR